MINHELIKLNKSYLLVLQKELTLVRKYNHLGPEKLKIMYNILNCRRILDNNNFTKYFELQERINQQLLSENTNTAFEKQCECLLKQIDIELDFLNKEITNESTR